jgi:hypothetical protein
MDAHKHSERTRDTLAPSGFTQQAGFRESGGMTPEEEIALLKAQLHLSEELRTTQAQLLHEAQARLQQLESHQSAAFPQTKTALSLKREVLLSHIKNSFSVAYLTFVSIIQGVALGYLVAFIFSNYQHFSPATWVNAYTSFMVILLVWAQTLLDTFSFKYILDIFDILVVFVYFLLEILLFSFINTESLFLLFSLFATGLALLDYVYIVKMAHKYVSDNEYVLYVFKKRNLIVLTYVGLVVYVLLFLVVFLLSEKFGGSQTLNLLFSLLVALASSLYLVKFSFTMNALVKAE